MTNRQNRTTLEQSRTNTIKLGKLILQNSNRATSEARKAMYDKDLAFFLIQEPHSINSAVKGFGLTTTNTVLGNLTMDARPMAAMVCKSSKKPPIPSSIIPRNTSLCVKS